MATSDGSEPEKPSFLYILRCGGGAFYAGITIDVQRRLSQDNAGKGCAFTARRRPVELV